MIVKDIKNIGVKIKAKEVYYGTLAQIDGKLMFLTRYNCGGKLLFTNFKTGEYLFVLPDTEVVGVPEDAEITLINQQP